MPYTKKQFILMGFVFLLSLIFWGPVLSFGQEMAPKEVIRAGSAAAPFLDQTVPFEETLTPQQRRLLRQELILSQLRSQFSNTQKYRSNLDKKIDTTKERLQMVGQEIASLQNQLAYFEMNIQETEQKIKDIIKQTAWTELEISHGYEDIETKEVELQQQSKILSDYFAWLYFHKNKFYDHGYETINALKLLLADENVSENLARETYLQLLEKSGDEIFSKLQTIRLKLDTRQQNLQMQRVKLSYLQDRLKTERDNLALQKANQEKLLDDTKGREEIFQKMLVESIKEQNRADQEMAALQTNISYFSKEAGTQQSNLKPEDYAKILKIKEDMVATAQGQGHNDAFKFSIWPVHPNSVSAYFHDERYQRIFAVDHGALDLPENRGTPILAPADCLVMKVVDQDSPDIYNEITCAGPQGVMFKFGHVYQSLAKKGELIPTGGLVGMTGGCIGERGSGPRTTGCHLHFEVWMNGEKVDPLKFLPLDELPIEYIPAEYLKDLDLPEGVTSGETGLRSGETAVISGESEVEGDN